MNGITLSVIVPVFNAENYLCKCVDSVLVQTFDEIELILVNDGSTDLSPQICEQYKNNDKRVKVIHKTNKGASNARKAGMMAAVGEYVAFIDADDWIEPNMYEDMMRIAQTENADVVICDYISEMEGKSVYKKQNIVHGLYVGDNLLDKFYPKMLYTGEFYKFGVFCALWNKIYKKDVIADKILNANELILFGEDALCVYPSLLSANSIFVMNEAYYYHYRQNPTSLSNSYNSNKVASFINLAKSINRVLNLRENIDMSVQINNYLYFMFIGVISNEINSKDNIFKIKKRIECIYDCDEITDALRYVLKGKMSFKHKVFLSACLYKCDIFVIALFNIYRNFRIMREEVKCKD